MDRMVFARHLHLANHQTPPQRVTVADIAARYGDLDAVVIEEHGDCLDPAKARGVSGPKVIAGCEGAAEIHSSGRKARLQHVGLLGVDAYEQSALHIRSTDSPQVLRGKVLQAGGAMVFNHPEYPEINKTKSSAGALKYDLPLAEAKSFDAIELFNDVGFTGSDPVQVLKWVEKTFYARGAFPAIVAGQDDHGPSPKAEHPTYTMAMVEHKDETGLVAAVRDRRTYASKSRDAFVSLNVDGLPAWSAATLAPGRHRFQAGLSGLPDGAVVELVRNGKVAARTVSKGGQAVLDLDLKIKAGKKSDYLYLQVWSEPGRLHTVSSAVVLQAAALQRLPLIPIAP